LPLGIRPRGADESKGGKEGKVVTGHQGETNYFLLKFGEGSFELQEKKRQVGRKSLGGENRLFGEV